MLITKKTCILSNSLAKTVIPRTNHHVVEAMEGPSENPEAKYDEMEQWCQEQIKRGSDFFFDPKLFRSTLRTKSKEWGFPQEVRTSVKALSSPSRVDNAEQQQSFACSLRASAHGRLTRPLSLVLQCQT